MDQEPLKYSDTCEQDHSRIAASPVGSRIAIHDGDFLRDPIPDSHDVAILANIIHGHSPEQNLSLFRAVRHNMPPAGRLLIVDFWMDPTHTDPLFGALMAGEFLVNTSNGDVYSYDEGENWLPQTGWQKVNRLPLAGPLSLLVGQAT